MPILKITWHTHIDERTCPLCAPLNGHVWTFNSQKDAFPEYLIAPMGGPPVWNCQTDEPLTHGPASRRGPWNCRCTLTWTLDDMDLHDTIQKMRVHVQQLKGEMESLG